MIDQVIVGLYLLITLMIGLYVGRNTNTIEDFAIGRRNFSTIVLVSTVFASVVDAGMTTGLASSTYSIGPIFLLSFLGIIFSSLNVSFFIAPRMKPFMGLISSGDIFEKLYGRSAKTLMGCSTIIESTLTAAIQIFAIIQIGQYFFAMPPVVASSVVSLIIVIYTFRGGIRSVTATDVFQFGIMVIAIPIMCCVALNKIGGFGQITQLINNSPLYFPGQKGNNFEYLAVFISFSLPCLYPLCIQRMLMAKDTKQISSTFLINGLLSLPFYLTVGLIGIIAYIAIPSTEANVVFPALINEVLPVGIKGLVLAGLIAIFMSTIDSILNIGSLAIIHDVLGSVLKNGLKPKTELGLMKLASLLIAVTAVVICHLFTSVMDIVFFLMVVGNAIFFPGFLFGILGIKASKSGFWIGIGFSTLTVLLCNFVFALFPLYTMLAAIAVNSSVLLIDSFLQKTFRPPAFSTFLPVERKSIIKNIKRASFFSTCVRNQDYCSIFFVCAIIISLFPFFFPASQGLTSFDASILCINIIIAIISLCMLFRELWWDYLDKVFPVIWIASLTLALPTQSLYMLFQSQLSFVWLADCLVILPLMFMLTTRGPLIISCALGLLTATILFKLGPPSITPEIAANFGYWALAMHFVILAICLALFRRHDQKTFVVTSSTLAHEASRSFLAFENAACYLNTYLPTIINSYRNNNHQNEVSTSALDELLELPSQLEQAAIRSRYVVEKLSFSSISKQAHFEEFSILTSVQNALNDPSLRGKLGGRVSTINMRELRINGDISQITQLFINLLENAYHAISSKPDAKIEIIIDEVVLFKDTGEGIDKYVIANIFDEFYSTKSSTGQGLAFCKRIMRNHGGTISCSSIKDEFTEFRLSFPKLKKDKPDV